MHGTVGTARAWGFAVALTLLAPAGGAVTTAQQTDDWCREDNWGRDRAGVCDVRQFTVAATSGVLSVSGTNGGIRVDGQARGDVLILAKVVATAATEARAREIANSIQLNPTLERVRAEGPRTQNREGWSVSYRIAVPRALNVSVETSNGGIVIQDLDSKVDFRTSNGGVKLIGLAGEVRGRTSNGGIDVDLDGQAWIGEGLEVETSNGGVRLSIPEHYSARLEASTHNGGMNIDYPGVSEPRDRDLSVQLGSGGAPIRVRTSNGGIRVSRK
jgi:hypothetical protein